MQAAFLGAACFLFARELARWTGWIAAGFAAFVIVLAVLIGEAAAAPLLAGDAPVRVWASSGPLTQAAAPALFASAMVRVAIKFAGLGPVSIKVDPVRPQPLSAAAAAPLALVALLIMTPLTPLRLLSANNQRANDLRCTAGARALLIDLKAANRLEIASGAGAEAENAVTSADLIRHIPKGAFSRPYFEKAPAGEYVGAVDVGPGSGRYWGFHVPPSLRLPDSGEVVLCVDPMIQANIVEESFYRVLSFRRQESRPSEGGQHIP